MIKFTIPGRLEGLNELILANRRNRFLGAKIKHEQTDICAAAASGCRRPRGYPLMIHIHWVEKNSRRDPDNVASAKKYILDGLQAAGIIENDGPKQIRGFIDTFSVDKDRPRIEVTIFEPEDVTDTPYFGRT